jgi:hypothetical protein
MTGDQVAGDAGLVSLLIFDNSFATNEPSGLATRRFGAGTTLRSVSHQLVF